MARVRITIATLEGELLEYETLEGSGTPESMAESIIEVALRRYRIVGTPSLESGEEE
jgi:hypothetical protein